MNRFLRIYKRWRCKRHARWLRKAKVVLPMPNPRSVVYRRWNVPE